MSTDAVSRLSQLVPHRTFQRPQRANPGRTSQRMSRREQHAYPQDRDHNLHFHLPSSLPLPSAFRCPPLLTSAFDRDNDFAGWRCAGSSHLSPVPLVFCLNRSLPTYGEHDVSADIKSPWKSDIFFSSRGAVDTRPALGPRRACCQRNLPQDHSNGPRWLGVWHLDGANRTCRSIASPPCIPVRAQR